MSKHHRDHKRSKGSGAPMVFDRVSFGSICINGMSYEHDVVIDRGEVRKRDKKPSKKFRDDFGHTPLSIEEEIPWKCHRLVIGTGGGAFPIMKGGKTRSTSAVKPTAYLTDPVSPSRLEKKPRRHKCDSTCDVLEKLPKAQNEPRMDADNKRTADGRRFTQIRTAQKMNRKSVRTFVTFAIFCE